MNISDWRALIAWGGLMVGVSLAIGAEKRHPEANVAWQEDFAKPFSPAKAVGVEQTHSGDKVVLADIERKNGTSHVGFHVPLSGAAYRYLQLDLKGTEGTGYRRFALRLAGVDGGLGDGMAPGLYTYDLLTAYPQLQGQKQAEMILYVLGEGTQQTPVPPGVRFMFDSLSLVKQPSEGVAVKITKGVILKAGSKLRVTVWTPPGTKDVTVEFSNWIGKPVSLNSEPYIQASPANADSSLWEAEVVVGEKLLPPQESLYGKTQPMGAVRVTATVIGGKREQLYTSVAYPVQWSSQ